MARPQFANLLTSAELVAEYNTIVTKQTNPGHGSSESTTVTHPGSYDSSALLEATLHRLDNKPYRLAGNDLLELVTLVSMQAPVVIKRVLAKLKRVHGDKASEATALLELGRVLCEQPADSYEQQLWTAIEPDGASADVRAG